MTSLAREYGEAIYELARDEDLGLLVFEQLDDISALLKQQPEFIRLLCSRAIDRGTRLKIVDDTFGNRVHPYVTNFMKLLVQKEHFDAFLLCAQWFHQRYNDDNNIRCYQSKNSVTIPIQTQKCFRIFNPKNILFSKTFPKLQRSSFPTQ